MEKDTQANGNQKTALISILTSDDIDFELTMLQGQRRSLYNDKKKEKRQSVKKHCNCTYIHALNIRAPKYIKQLLTEQKAKK